MTYIKKTAFKLPKFLVTSHTSQQITTTTINDSETVIGSQISYTPSIDANKVVYEISFYSQKANSGGIVFRILDLEESSDGGSSWSVINQKFKKNHGLWGTSGQKNRYYMHFRYVLPTWSGERYLRLRTSTYTDFPNRSSELHQLTEWNGTSATDQFCNTNLLVYSI